jgi:hypothetical protein
VSLAFIKLRSRLWLLFCLLSLNYQGVAQDNKIQQINEVCARLDNALKKNDTIGLKLILHTQLSLGHSNGLIEDKNTLFDHLRSGYLKYSRIEEEGMKEVQFVQNIATVRRQVKVSGALNGLSFDIKLKVLEVWLKENKEWELLCRQSVKAN